MKHTPGPWGINPQSIGGAPEITAPTSWIGVRRIAKVLYEGGSEDPEVHANAQLIKAAPDLLEACLFAFKVLSDMTTDEFAHGRDIETRIHLESAIAKAIE